MNVLPDVLGLLALKIVATIQRKDQKDSPNVRPDGETGLLCQSLNDATRSRLSHLSCGL
jgi:hypothetical protein